MAILELEYMCFLLVTNKNEGVLNHENRKILSGMVYSVFLVHTDRIRSMVTGKRPDK